MVLITLNSKESDFEIYFKDPIPLSAGGAGRNRAIGLLSATAWHSWYNISEEFENNKLKILLRGKWEVYTIPDGNYDADNLNYWIEDVLQCSTDCPVRFDINSATNRFMIILDNCQIDLSDGKLHEILGFEPREYKDKINVGEHIGNISRGVDRLLIHCSLVSDSYENKHASDIIYSFSPSSAPPGAQITVEPFQPKYLPIRSMDYIYSLRIKVTDQNNNLINFHGETLTFVLDIK